MTSEIFKDPMFFYGIAFAIFLVIALRYGRKPFVGWVDGEIQKISDELDHAEQLRKEAEATLADCKARQAAAHTEAEEIVAHAKLEAQRLREQTAAELDAAMKRHEQLAVEHIRLAQTHAQEEVRLAVVDMALQMARQAIAHNLTEADTHQIADEAILELARLGSGKAKAA